MNVFNLSTLESLPPDRRPIWNVRSNFSKNNSLDTKSYETSVQELIGIDQGYGEFFDTSLTDNYRNSWLPTGTDFPGLGLNSLTSSLVKQGENSWFWTREHREIPRTCSLPNVISGRISCPLFTFSPQDTTEEESTSQEPPKKRRKKKSQIVKEQGKLIRSYRLRLAPTREQFEELRRLQGCHRFLYNKVVSHEKNGEIQGASGNLKSEFRTRLTTNDKIRDSGDVFLLDCPVHTRQQAVEEFFRSKKAAMSNVRNGHQESFSMDFRSRFKAQQQTFPLEKYKLNTLDSPKITLYTKKPYMEVKIAGTIPGVLRSRKDVDWVRDEVKITRTRLGVYSVSVSVVIPQTSKYPGSCHGHMISIDPGVKSFLTFHSPDGSCGDIGRFLPLKRTLLEADNTKSKYDLLKGSRNARWRRHTFRRFLRKLRKVRCRISDLHKKIASWMCKRFRLILLPKFETSKMVSSNLISKTCRSMMTWSHYRFRRILVNMAQKFKEVKVLICNEAYTTKTCGSCGSVRDMSLNDRIFRCNSCGYVCDRDLNAARNIGLRSLKYLIDI